MQGSMIDNQDTSAYIKDEPLFNPKSSMFLMGLYLYPYLLTPTHSKVKVQ